MTCFLDSLRHFALELKACTGDTAWQNFTLLVEELLQEIGVLVVDVTDTGFFYSSLLFLAFVSHLWSEETHFIVLCPN